MASNEAVFGQGNLIDKRSWRLYLKGQRVVRVGRKQQIVARSRVGYWLHQAGQVVFCAQALYTQLVGQDVSAAFLEGGKCVSAFNQAVSIEDVCLAARGLLFAGLDCFRFRRQIARVA